jgi:hypothetical protein
MGTKGYRSMRISPRILLFLAMPLAASCSSRSPDDLSQGVDDAPALTPDQKTFLEQRPPDYPEALRTASLRLLRGLPTLEQIKTVAASGDQKAAYEAEIDKMLDDPRFNERMIKWWSDVMRMGGGAQNGKPSRDTAPIFAARILADELPYTDLFTATKNNCPTYDFQAHAFVDGECTNGAPAQAGVLTNPGVMYQFYSSMAFRRVRWLQEIFVCTKFPAEYSEMPVHMGTSDYTSPWVFGSIAAAPVNFQDTASVICANCHTTINHVAPLFGNFDDAGQYQGTIQVKTPIAPDAVPTELAHWLNAGEKTSWRLGEEVADLTALGAAVAGDPDVAACAVTRMWNFAMSKEDVVSDLATVPAAVIQPYLVEFSTNGLNMKKTLRSMFTSDDFVRF